MQELILSIPLCDSWPADNLIWHYHSRGLFSVRTAYYMLISDSLSSSRSSSTAENSLWRTIWRCNGPPRTRLFGWRAAKGIFPYAVAIAKCVSSFPKGCVICGHLETLMLSWSVHFASQIWEGCGFDTTLWTTRFHTIVDCLDNAQFSLDNDCFRNFLVVMCECWNARNRFIFNNPNCDWNSSGKKAFDFVHSYRATHALESRESHPPVP